jgi:hypothetical protein
MSETEEQRTDIIETPVVEALERAQIDVQIATAKRYPRSVKAFKQSAEQLACQDEKTARACFYRLKRKDKDGRTKIIEGASVRLAEIAGSSWGNCSYGARVVDEGERYITAQGVCFDLENNVRSSIEVRRRITTKKGHRFGDDMIAVTANAACSIALRNAIFKVIPFALLKEVLEKAKETSLGGKKPFGEKREAAFQWYRDKGAKDQQILAALGKPGIVDVDIDDLLTLRGMATAINDGELTLKDALEPPKEEPEEKAESEDEKPPEEPTPVLVDTQEEKKERSAADEKMAALGEWKAVSANLSDEEIVEVCKSLGLSKIKANTATEKIKAATESARSFIGEDNLTEIEKAAKDNAE